MAPHATGDASFYESNTPSSAYRLGPHMAEDEDKVDPIAVVGLSFGFPQDATSSEAFWDLMMEKRNTGTVFPKERLNVAAMHHPDANRRGQIPVQGAHFLKGDIAAFDAPFFTISAADAAAMDPQQRGLLEYTYRALENAGIPVEKVTGSKTSVYTGCFTNDWQLLSFKDPEQCETTIALGAQACVNANRISWFFNFTGNSANIDTACSSSLVSLDLGCKGLLSGDTEMSIVAGCNLIFSPDFMHALTNMNMLSPNGQCYSFDHRGNGYARGEGFGVVVLKRLSDALRDRDTIRAIIRSTGCNQDGYTPGITQPNSVSQEALIRETYAKAGLSMQNTRFFEAHGTGTPIGDPTESTAIGAAFRKIRTHDDPLIVGAVKSNIGHLEGASGVAGLIKTILILERATIPPNTNFEKINPKIDTEFLRIKLPLEPTPWPTKGLRRASVNSFGFGGSNAHVVLDDVFHYLKSHSLTGNHITVQNPPNQPVARNLLQQSPLTNGSSKINTGAVLPKLLVFSTNDERGVKRQAIDYASHFAGLDLRSHQIAAYLENLAYTLAYRRTTLPWKSFAVATSMESLRNLEVEIAPAVKSNVDPAIAFVFTGQGAQWAGMGRELSAYPVFEQSLQRAEKYLIQLGCPWNLREEILKDAKSSNINRPELSQPVCTAIQVALVDLLQSFGIDPTAVVGHSSGEIAAAYCLGAISAKAAWKIAYYRGTSAADLANSGESRGAMISVGLSQIQVQPFIDEIATQFGRRDLTIACINSHKNVTVSGDAEQVEALKSICEKERVFARKLLVDVAYHSPQMELVASDYRRAISTIEKGQSTKLLTMVSSVTGQKVTNDELSTPDYWVANLVSPVRFSESVGQLFSRSAQRIRKKLDLSHKQHFKVNMLVEIGPHPALQGPIRDILTRLPNASNITYSSVLARKSSALDSMLTTIGRIKCLGYPVDLKSINHPGPFGDNHCMALPDLPEYPFDHSKDYWYESRLSNRSRTQHQRKLDLLGKPVQDWNPLEAKWRNVIRVSEMPWVEDHVINGSLIYPAAGMLVMAIEAANQMADPTQDVLGFELKETSFQRSLTIPQDSAGIEVQLSLHLLNDTNNAVKNWSEFRLCAYENSQWHECCRGLIRVEYQSNPSEVDSGKEILEELNACRRLEASMTESCQQPLDPRSLYQTLTNSGFGFGPSFQPITKGAFGTNNEAKADVKLFQWPASQYPQPHVVHPTSLDGMLHLAIAGYAKGGQRAVPTMIPTLLRSIWISKKGLSYPENPCVKTCTWMTAEDNRGKEFDASVLDPVESMVLAQIRGLRLTMIADAGVNNEDPYQKRQICYHVDHKPDPDMLRFSQTSEYCGEVSNDQNGEAVDRNRDLAFLVLSFLQRAIDTLSQSSADQLSPTLASYVTWAKLQLDKLQRSELPYNTSDWLEKLQDRSHVESLCTQLGAADNEARILISVGQKLTSILSGEVDAHEFLIQSGLLQDFNYASASSEPCFQQLDRYLDLLGHKYPELKILEIGADLGGMTENILRALSKPLEDGSGANFRYSSYEFTATSGSSLEQAQQKFQKFQNYQHMNFSRLHIEQDPVEQGFEEGTYDLIVAVDCLTKYQDVQRALRNMRKLLSPKGKFISFEPAVENNLLSDFVSRLVSDQRLTPQLSTFTEWRRLLSENGLSNIDLEIINHADKEYRGQGIMVASKAVSEHPTSSAKRIVFIVDIRSPLQRTVSERLNRIISEQNENMTCETMTLIEAAVSLEKEKSIFVCLLDLEQPFLYSLTSDTYSILQKLLVSAKDQLWVNSFGGSVSGKPEYGILNGLARALRNEYEAHRFTTLALDIRGDLTEQQLDTVHDILRKNHFNPDHVDGEPEYVEIDGRLNISRVVQNPRLSQDLYFRSIPQQTKTQTIRESPPLRLAIGSPGLLDTLHFVEDKENARPLNDDEVEIQTHAIGMNFKDCLIALGQVSGTTFGLECAGIVTRAGRASDLISGDRVVLAAPGSFRTFSRGKAASACLIPDGLSFTEAASIPAQFGTAWEVVHEMARLKKGETILIHAGAGGTGQAAIQVAQYLGATIFATVGSKDKKQLLIDEYGIPETHIFYSRDTSFAKGIKRVTAGRGVDVVINSLAGESLVASWECIARYGRFIEIGKRDIIANASLPMLPFGKNASFMGFDTSCWNEEKPAEVRRDSKILLDLFANKTFHTCRPLHVYNISQVEEVFRLMQEGKTAGKIVLEVTEDAQVTTTLDTKPTAFLDPAATYVIAGGLGGLGRSMARWMVSRNAKNLILLSRSGARTEVAHEFLEEIRSQGVRVEAPACNVADTAMMNETFDHYAKEMPPIKGCIQGSMVRRDELFENMGFESWSLGVECKTIGSWNLHNVLPNGMDFFIILSSASGLVGLRGQTNYAAGNTYEDAIARHRVSQGEKAISLDLGAMIDDGLLAETPELLNRVLAYGALNPVSRTQFYAILDYYCDSSLPALSPFHSQSVIGLGVGGGPGLDGVDLARQPMFRHLLHGNERAAFGSGEEDDDKINSRELLAQSTSLVEAGSVVTQALIKKLSKSLSTMQDNDVDVNKPLHAYGVDSLLAVELRNWFAKEFQADVAVFETLGGATFSTLGMLVAGRSAIKHPNWNA